MAKWLAGRIELEKLNYNEVIAKYPEFKNDIDAYLGNDTYSSNMDNTTIEV